MAKRTTLELFEEPDFKGNPISLHGDVPDLSANGFLNEASSMRITGDPWVVYKGKNYGGDYQVYKQGNYSSIPEFNNQIASVRVVKGGLYNPKITVFEHIHYGGKTATITHAERSLKPYEMDNMISSHKVESGCWILYEKENYQGRNMITLAGDEVADYRSIDWNDKVNSLKPAEPYI
ncbi:epidermal differentiation-specific protein-like [Mixophyes fleayi]|uniref:epidermal differentiation-specific protein-like n=1 Tax=Mixophyes fleayi TaxID=3061075 RepID=UPI003F4D99C5